MRYQYSPWLVQIMICHQVFIWTNDGLLLTGPMGIGRGEIEIKIWKCSFRNMHLKLLSAKKNLFRIGFLRQQTVMHIWYWCAGTALKKKNVAVIKLWCPKGPDQISWRHEDVIKWKRFPCYWPFVSGVHRWPVDSLTKGQWRGALMLRLNKTVEQTIETPVIWDDIALIMTPQ